MKIATMSDFARTFYQERTKYGIHEIPPVQAFQRSLDRLNSQLAEFGIVPEHDCHLSPEDGCDCVRL